MCKSSGRDTPQSGGRCGSRLWLFAPQSLGTCAPPSVDASATCSGSRSWRWHFPAMRPRPPVSPTQRPAKPSLSRRRGLSGCTSRLSRASRQLGSAGISGSPTARMRFASHGEQPNPGARRESFRFFPSGPHKFLPRKNAKSTRRRKFRSLRSLCSLVAIIVGSRWLRLGRAVSSFCLHVSARSCSLRLLRCLL